MNTSELINELAEALGKAQSQMTGAKKASANPFFKSKYSDLSQVMEAISKPFADNDLCFVQGAEADELRVAVSTRIIHKSGQWIESTTILPPTKPDAQGWGSAITYAKRYGLQALAGVPSVDDDGNAAVNHTKPSKPKAGSVKINDIKAKFEACKTVDDLHVVWGELDPSMMSYFEDLKNTIKTKLGE